MPSEAEFARQFQSFLEEIDGQTAVFFPEVLTASGMPDLVAVTTAGGADFDDLCRDSDISSLTNGRAVVAASLCRRRGHRLDYVARTTGHELEYVRRAAAELVAAGLASRDDFGLLRLGPDWPDVLPQLNVFELKLTHWKKALAQSLRYRRLAKRVTVVMPPRPELAADRITSSFSRHGVGLAQFDPETSSLRYLVRPRVIGPTSRAYYYDALGRLVERCPAPTAESPARRGKNATTNPRIQQTRFARS